MKAVIAPVAAALVAAACLGSGHAQQGAPHQHGSARLEVSTEGNAMDLRLESPLDSLVGFESAPRTAKQREAIRQMAGRFHQPEGLFVPTAEAGCSATSVILHSDVLASGLLNAPGNSGATGAKAVGTAGETGSGTAGGTVGRTGSAATDDSRSATGNSSGRKHADLDVEITYQCQRPQALEGVRVLLFEAFPGLNRIDAQVVTGKGQSSTRLSPKSSLLRW